MHHRALATVVLSFVAWIATCALAQVVVEEGYIPVADGVDLYYVKVGEGVPPPPPPPPIYTGVPLSALADDRTVVFFDNRGRGLSTPVSEPSQLWIDEQIADFGRVQDHFQAESVAVLGWSIWGTAAQVYAARNPGRVSAVIAFGPAPPARRPFAFMDPLSPFPDFRALNSYLRSAPDDADPFEVCLGAKDIAMPSQVVDTSVLPDINKKLCAIPNERDDNIMFINQQLGNSLGDWNYLDELNTLGAPLLIIHGDADTVVPEAIAANVEAVPDARAVVVADAGHMGFVEHPDHYVRLVDAFLDSLP